MNCKSVQQQIIEDLSHRCDEAVKIHLECCPECRQLCDDLIALEDLARSLGDQYKVPAGFGSRVLAHTHRKTFLGFFGLRPILVLLLIVMLPLGLFLMDDGAASRNESFVTEDAAHREVSEDPEYIEVVIDDPEQGELILRLPSVIEIHRTELHEDFNYQNTGF